MCVSQGDNEEGKWKKHWVRTCDLHNLLAEEIDIPGASISKPRECTAKVVGIPAEVCLCMGYGGISIKEEGSQSLYDLRTYSTREILASV